MKKNIRIQTVLNGYLDQHNVHKVTEKGILITKTNTSACIHHTIVYTLLSMMTIINSSFVDIIFKHCQLSKRISASEH